MSAKDLPETVTINKSEYEQLKLDSEELEMLYQLSLSYRPPEFKGDEVSVRCVECGHIMSGDEFAEAARMLEVEMQRVRKVQIKPKKRA